MLALIPRRTAMSFSTRRCFATASTRLQRSSLESPTYAGLYYHPSPASPTAWALSFLPSPAPFPAFSPTTIGLLDYRNPLGQGSSSMPDLTPRNFTENPQFREVMHDILKGIVAKDETLDTMAKTRPEDGYIHIADARTSLDPNRVPDPSDIIASLLVSSGRVVPSSYEPGRMHRLVVPPESGLSGSGAGQGGLMRLEEGLMRRFREGLERVRQVEEEVGKEAEKEGEVQ